MDWVANLPLERVVTRGERCPEPVLLKLLLAINLALAAVLYSSDYQIAVLVSSVLSSGRQSDCCLTAAPVAGTVSAEG